MSRWALALCLLVAPDLVTAGPADAVAAALADASKQPPGVQPYLRYLSLYNIQIKHQKQMAQADSFWINSISRESEIVPPALVGDLVRINLLDYNLNPRTWEKFADIDPFFHAVVVVEEVIEIEYERTTYQGHEWVRERGGGWILAREWKKGRAFKEKVKKRKAAASAPWLDDHTMAALVKVTQSQAPILRADWFAFQVCRQVDLRNRQTGVGYYDWLDVKDRDAFDRLVRLDKKVSQELGKDKRAALDRSGVSQQNRRVVRFQSITGGYWITFDVKDSTDRGNFLRVLDDKDFKHDAEEIYAVLPNGLFAYFLSDFKGVRQDSAPDFIGPDDSPLNTTRDSRIHSAVACVRCHTQGLRDVDDWVRKTYQGPIQLTSPDYKEFIQLRKQYLSELEITMSRDRQIYFDAVRACNGLDSKENARVVAEVYSRYWQFVTFDEMCREWDVAPEFIKKQFLDLNQKLPGQLDPLLVSTLRPGFEGLLRQHFEEVFGLGMLAIRGVIPPLLPPVPVLVPVPEKPQGAAPSKAAPGKISLGGLPP